MKKYLFIVLLVGVGFGPTEDWIYKPHIRGFVCLWDDVKKVLRIEPFVEILKRRSGLIRVQG